MTPNTLVRDITKKHLKQIKDVLKKEDERRLKKFIERYEAARKLDWI